MERQSCTKMNFLKKLRFWKRRRNDAVNRDIATTDNRNSETGTQVSSTEMILRCHAGTQVDFILTWDITANINVNERPQNRTDGGAAENGKEKMKGEVATLEKLLEEKDRLIRKQNAIQEMKDKVATSNSSKRKKKWRRVTCCAKSGIWERKS